MSDSPDPDAAPEGGAGGGQAAGPGDDAGGAGDAPHGQRLDPAVARFLMGLRQRSITAIGEAVLVLGATTRYRDQTLGDMRNLVLEPLDRDRIVIVREQTPPESPATRLPATGIAIWASVSDEVDARLRDQVREGVFPLRLGPGDWASGEIVWLLDAIAPTREFGSRVVRQFRRVARAPKIRLSPMVARVIDPALLSELAGASAAASEGSAGTAGTH